MDLLARNDAICKPCEPYFRPSLRRKSARHPACLGGNLLSTIRVLVVDDYEPWMTFVSAVLAASPQFQVVGQAGNGLTALQKVVELKPDLVVL
ncbi:MAG TPA: hypothetical protein VFP11_02635, partial [Candidatus Angelobacter sp.]|nr:hypothetical protein [Candidatus Angelobacter sp.]